MSQNTIISTGTTYRLFGEAVQTHSKLPVQTYKVSFHPMQGYWLEKVEPLSTMGERMFGKHEERLERIVSSWNRSDRSLGVMLTGDKGMGKSLMVRLIAERMGNSEQLPVVIVDENSPGLANFLDQLQTCIVVFDEFEKVFPPSDMDESHGSSQDQFLGLFDGMSTTKRMYLVTANAINKLSDFLVNRPGRFHYHLRFDYPSMEETKEYLIAKAPSASMEQVDAVAVFSRKVDLNFDHLRSIAFELEGGVDFADIIDDLNIKRMRNQARYLMTITLKDGTKIKTNESLDLFGESVQSFSYRIIGKEDRAYTFSPDSVQYNEDGVQEIDVSNLTAIYGSKKSTAAVKVILERPGAENYSYGRVVGASGGVASTEVTESVPEWELDLATPAR